MNGIFLSYSSDDRPIVSKVACHLLSENFPIWFDIWNMELGDSLLEKIYGGISDSFFLILFLSKSSVKSEWVMKELKAALNKEEKIQRKFLLPVLIESCDIPIEISDRIYADFSRSFTSPFEKLVLAIKSFGADQFILPFEKQLIPIVFNHEVELDNYILDKRLNYIRSNYQQNNEFEANQIVVNIDKDYMLLRQKILAEIDKSSHEEFYSIKDHRRAIHGAYNVVVAFENLLIKGIVYMLNEILVKRHLGYTFDKSVFWFCKMMRSQAVSTLHAFQKRSTNYIEYGRKASRFLTIHKNEQASFYNVDKLYAYVINIDNRYIKFCMDPHEYLGSNTNDISLHAITKYIVPQLVYNKLVHNEFDTIDWVFDNMDILND
ncbi:MAG: toll/interleukin-1 receptor domain-containing protein [Chlorobiales bacterium]|nr:toll/interleukin-1 receptor domain-containing protein [Chlorobiales bacterium]